MYFSCTDFDEKCSKEDDWDVDMSGYYDSGMNIIQDVYSGCMVTVRWLVSIEASGLELHSCAQEDLVTKS